MNRDEIIRLAHEADCLDNQHYGTVWANKLEHFAKLVAAATIKNMNQDKSNGNARRNPSS